ncbi:MAG: hypothetical protein AAFN10_15785 [Bacteroidota bacterium]
MKEAINQETYERLLRWCEGSLSKADALQLEEEMHENQVLREKANELKQFYALGQAADFHFKPFLAGRVLHQLEQQTQSENPLQSLQFAFSRLALPAFAIMLLLLAITFVGEQSLSIDAVLGLADLNVEDLYSEYIISL